MSKLVIGLDFGSDSVRGILVDTADGNELASSVYAYQQWKEGRYSDPAKSQFRQHPADYLTGIETVIKAILVGQNAASVVGIGVDTTGSTPCAVNQTGTPLALTPAFAADPDAMFILWKDHTAIKEAAEITRAAKLAKEDYTRFEGGVYSSEWFWSKVLHILRTNDKVRTAAFSWVEHCDWVTAELAGDTNPLTLKRSRCAAGHKAMWHPSWGGLPPEEFLTSVDPLLKGLRSCLYTDTFTADIPVGTLSKKWADKLGLSTKVVISGGAFDCHAGAVGAGIEPGQMVKVVGTSTCDIIVAPEVGHCVKGICGQVDGSVLPGYTGLEAGQSAFGDIYAWFKRFLSYAGEVNLAKLEAEAAALPISDVLALDWMNGRRTPDANQYLAGAIFNLNLGTTAPMVFRALAESTVFGSRRIAEHFQAENIAIERVLAIGGIAKKSQFVMQLCADIMKMPIQVAKSEQACALGAAIFAAAAAKVYPNTATAVKHMRSGVDAVYTPDPVKSKRYDQLYQKYLACADMVEKETMKHV